MKYIFGLFIMFLTYLLIQNNLERQYKAGFEAGTKTALKTNPPSEDLEMVCAGLWIGEQNKKYYNKENRNAR